MFSIVSSVLVSVVIFAVKIDGVNGEECQSYPDEAIGICTESSKCPSYIQVLANGTKKEIFRGRIYCVDDSTTLQPDTPKNPLVCCDHQSLFESKRTDEICTDPNGFIGICKHIKECPNILSELAAKQNDASYVQYIRKSNTNCNFIGRNICCPYQPQKSLKIVHDRLLTIEEGCGFADPIRPTIPPTAFVGGIGVVEGEYPWMALIGYKNNLGQSSWRCGGTLITSRHVLTAAHCVTSTLSNVRLGEHDISSVNDGPTQDINVIRAVRHPDYDKRDGTSDIAILYLEHHAEFSDRVKPICLPTNEITRSLNITGFAPVITGWGRLQEGGQTSDILQRSLNAGAIKILDNSVCKDRFKKQNMLKSEKQFGDAVVCAGKLTGGEDACEGDSGGPLKLKIAVSVDDSRFFQFGIVSYGINGCARPDTPGVYTRVQKFVDWIQEKVSE